MKTHRLTLSATQSRRLRRLPQAERGLAVEHALAARAEGTAQVLDVDAVPLKPCAMPRARELVARRRATWVTQSPPTIRLLPRGHRP
jgi:hypothetical protein